MILQALVEYYERKAANPEIALPRLGFETKEIPFLIVLDRNGRCVQLDDTRIIEGKKKRAKSFIVPQGVKKTSGVAANVLWDNLEYVLGIPVKSKPERVIEQHAAFLSRMASLPQEDEGIQAIRTFLSSRSFEKLEASEVWKECLETNPLFSFRLTEDGGSPIFERPALMDAIEKMNDSEDVIHGTCLITGQTDRPIERLHTSIKGVWGAQTAGANIVSFNLRAFESYGNEQKQGENAPVSVSAAFAYTTALNYLLGKDSKQRIQVGDASTIFWADKSCALEESFSFLFSEPHKDNDDHPDRNVEAVKVLYESVQRGKASVDKEDNRFFVLGLAPNAARIAIRFWLHGTVQEFSERIVQHFEDLKIEHASFENPYLSLFRLLLSVATQHKADHIPPNLGGEVMRSILQGLPYPTTLFQAAVRRFRIEQEGRFIYPQAAIIKAYLNRNYKEKLTVSLNINHTNPGYLLGRLFAVLEKIQAEAQPDINATIRDRFYGAASSTPVTVFRNLIKLSTHHLPKLEEKRRIYFDKLTGEILEKINDFPRLLPIEDQGRFAIGYYHQKQDFYKKSDSEKGE
jgi:CRISPR-associated protein Csd1